MNGLIILTVLPHYAAFKPAPPLRKELFCAAGTVTVGRLSRPHPLDPA